MYKLDPPEDERWSLVGPIFVVLFVLGIVGFIGWKGATGPPREPVAGYDYPAEHRYDGGITCYTFREQIACVQNDQAKAF